MPKHTEPSGNSSSSTGPAQRSRRPELRSRRGCLTCKQRRKKCDEDFQTRSNGAVACTRCSDRKLDCILPNSAGSTGGASTNPGAAEANFATPIRSPLSQQGSSSTGTLSNDVGLTHAQRQQQQKTQPGQQQQQHPYVASQQANPNQVHQQHPLLHHAAWNLSSLGNGAAAYSSHFPFLGHGNQFASAQNSSNFGSSLQRPSSRFNPSNSTALPWSGNYGVQEGGMGSPAAQLAIAGQVAAMQGGDYSALANAASAGNASSVPTQFIPNPPVAAELEDMMLDDFVQELMSLADPGSGVDGPIFGTPARQNAAPTPSHGAAGPSREGDASVTVASGSSETPGSQPQHRQRSSSATVKSSSNGATEATEKSRFTSLEPGKAFSRYRKFLESNAMEPLLKKYSPIYERFWYATLMLSELEKRKAIIDHLMSVVHSHKTCQASTVAVCLAYHDLVHRMREDDKAAASRKLAELTTSSSSATNSRSTAGTADAPTFSNLAAQNLLDMFPEKRRRKKSGGSRTRDGADARGGDVEDSETDEGSDSFEESDAGTVSAADEEPDAADEAARSEALSGEQLSEANQPQSSDAYRTPGSTAASKGTAGRARPNSTTLAAIKSPEVWFELALGAMQRDVQELSIEQQLCITLNLRWALICFGGANKAREFMDEIGDVIDRSGYDMNTLIAGEKVGTLASTMLQTAVISDVLDAACGRGRRPRTQLNRASGIARQPPPKQHQPPPPFYSKISPVSFELLGCTMAVSNLGADIVEGKVTDVAEINRRSKDIEEKIARCAPWCDPNISGKMRVRLFALQEIWRQTTLIHLFQTVHRHGPLSSKLQGALEEIIGLATMLSPSTPSGNSRSDTLMGSTNAELHAQQDFWIANASWEMCCVWWLSSSVAVTRRQREFCLEQLKSLGMEKANLDNIEAIQKLWAHADETGHTVDWRDFVEERGMAITFIF
ncbi:hypothetical protein ACQY0O_004007 [Thecaphora frezii]